MDKLRNFIQQFKSDEATSKSISDLNIAIANFEATKSEESKSEIPNYFLLLINNFNNYLNRINVNNNTDADNIMLTLLNICIEIYNNLEDKENWKNIIDIINKIPNLVSTYLNTVITCYELIPDDIILSNTVLTYYFSYLIYKCILILYTLYFYLKYITLFLNELINESGEELPMIYFEVFSTYILTHANKTGLTTISCSNSNTNIACITIERVYNLIINLFHIDILGLIPEKNIISIHKINSRINFIKEKVKTFHIEEYKRVIYEYIIKNYNILKKINTVSINDYITIPQYTGICWFVSMLTCMCYSDYSKNLILSKIDSIKAKQLATSIESEKLFITIILKTILEVSANFLKYSEILNEQCDLFKFFKHNLTDYLLKKLNEVKKEKEISKIYSAQPLIIGDYDYYYINILNRLLLTGDKNMQNDITEVAKMGITADGSIILKSFYDILGINTLFIISSYSGTMYIEKSYKEPIPDIIFVEMRKEPNNLELLNKINIYDELEDIDESGFTYKGIKYKLDYKIYSSDSDNNVCTQDGCGHCVSSIHYDTQQYYYDSGSVKASHECDGDEIRIPCSLIRQDWINKTVDSTIDKKHFSMNKCFFRNVNVEDKSIHIEYKVHNEDGLLFYTDENIICAYVRVTDGYDPMTGGKNTTYKSTHKKVNIMNKNKTIIERIVYIDKNKNKFIKFNKKYEPLSTFKYNRKNKYFYM